MLGPSCSLLCVSSDNIPGAVFLGSLDVFSARLLASLCSGGAILGQGCMLGGGRAWAVLVSASRPSRSAGGARRGAVLAGLRETKTPSWSPRLSRAAGDIHPEGSELELFREEI